MHPHKERTIREKNYTLFLLASAGIGKKAKILGKIGNGAPGDISSGLVLKIVSLRCDKISVDIIIEETVYLETLVGSNRVDYGILVIAILVHHKAVGIIPDGPVPGFDTQLIRFIPDLIQYEQGIGIRILLLYRNVRREDEELCNETQCNDEEKNRCTENDQGS